MSNSHPYAELLKALNISSRNPAACSGTKWHAGTGTIDSFSPIDGQRIACVGRTGDEDFSLILTTAQSAFEQWRQVPAPGRAEVVAKIGCKFREMKNELGTLVSYEMGKSLSEGKGEVQEMIDICDFAVGLSRQLYGLTMTSERPRHRMFEQWHPLGIVGIITAFNFPVAVWAWNAMIASVCGDVTIWKPSEKTPLTAVACFQLIREVLSDCKVPEGVFNLLIGEAGVGEKLSLEGAVSLVSATGSTRMGRKVAEAVGRRLGKTILELGGNNALILTPQADLAMALPTIVFGAVGTAGQRCTTTRRLLIHQSIYEPVKNSLRKIYQELRIGDPLAEANHLGPLIDRDAVSSMQRALQAAVEQGGKIICGGEVLEGVGYESACYVRPALVEARNDMPIVQQETFAPILYLISYAGEVDQAILLQNDVRQGLSSAIFTRDLREAEQFLSACGSDCGIANVNLGTSGAEIGGAFGGEKDTGGGRESGSDAWKSYMRRQTNTVNYGNSAPLAQGIQFNIEV